MTHKHGSLPKVPPSVSTLHLTRGGGQASPSLFRGTKSRESSLQRKRHTRLHTDEGQRSEATSEAPTPSEWQLQPRHLLGVHRLAKKTDKAES